MSERPVAPRGVGVLYLTTLLGLLATGAALLELGSGSDPRVARGHKGAVATASPEASAAGLEMLERGGNAADAFVAASFAVSVTRPQSTGIGGGGFLIYADAASGERFAIDFREVAPAAATRDMYNQPIESRLGPRAGAVPGLVKGLCEVHARFGSGRLSLAEVLEPAIRLARDGFKVDGGLAWSCQYHKDKLLRYPASAALFVPGGEPLRAGQRLKQPELAQTLERIAASGAAGFYEGPVAQAIAAAMEADGGLISLEDLASYRVAERAPLIGRYHDHEVVSMPPPAGGVHMLQILNILEPFDIGQYPHSSPEHIHLLAEAMKRAYADRAMHSGDPDFGAVPTDWLISKEYAESLAASISLERATPSSAIGPGEAPKLDESDQTTHISVVDAAGNAASSTQTVNTALGSKYVVPGAGFILNNEMDDFAQRKGVANYFGGTAISDKNLIEARKRPLSSMSPSMVFDSRGRLELVVGTPGGTKIITSVLQVISNRVDFEMAPAEAVFAPRVHHQWRFPELLRFEVEGPSAQLKAGLEARGQGFEVTGGHFCNVQAVVRDPRTGQLTAVSDWRGSGRPAAR